MDYIEKEMWIEREDPRDETTIIRLFGVLRVPEGAEGALPAVICSHGFTANHGETDPYAIALAEAGFVTLALDFFGGGAEVRSDGTLLDMTVETEVDDLEAFVNAVAALPEVDEKRVSLLGCSQGGFVSTMVASRIPERVKALALMYPAFVLHDDALRLYPREEDVPDTYLAFPGMEFSRISRAYNLVARAVDPFQLMPSYPGSVLITHGDVDVVVPVNYSRRAARTFANAELFVIEGANHGYQDEHLAQAIALTREFLLVHGA